MFSSTVRSTLLALAASAIAVNATQSISLKVTGEFELDFLPEVYKLLFRPRS
jgi:hypothetical protein